MKLNAETILNESIEAVRRSRGNVATAMRAGAPEGIVEMGRQAAAQADAMLTMALRMPFVREFISQHPEYAEQVEDARKAVQ